MDEEGVDPRKGLPESLFRFVSSVSPIPNIDLFITDHEGRFLLSVRDDEYYGRGWHLPGGCIRLLETLDERIQKTAELELGTRISYNPAPILTVEALATGERIASQGNLERTHNICILYNGTLPENYDIMDFNFYLEEYERGYLKWFDYLPDDFLCCQRPMYEEFLQSWINGRIQK